MMGIIMVKFSYSKSFLLSLFFHGLILGFLVIELSLNAFKPSMPKTTLSAKKKEKPSINAYSVDANALNQEINQIIEERKAQENAKIAKQKSYERNIERLKQETLRQKRDLKLASQQRAKEEEKKRLSLKKQQQELQKVKERQQALKDKLDAAEKKLKDKKSQLAKLKSDAKKRAEKRKAAKAKALKIAEENQRLAELKAEEEKRVQTEVDKYKSLIITAISQNWIVPESANLSLSCKFQIMLSTSGEVLSVSLVKSSGDKLLDRSAQLAIYKASPLPVPQDTKVFSIFKILNLTVKPEDLKKIANG